MFKHSLLCDTQILRHMGVSVLVAAITAVGHIFVRRIIDVELFQGSWIQDLDKMSDFLTSLIGTWALVGDVFPFDELMAFHIMQRRSTPGMVFGYLGQQDLVCTFCT